MLNSVFGILLYYFLPNHVVWKMLSAQEKQIVLQSCELHNNIHYDKPENYDAEHNRSESADQTREGKLLLDVFKTCPLSSVLEIGPGNGFYTRLLLNQPALERYVGIDIVRPFVEHVKTRVFPDYPGRAAEVVCGQFLEYAFDSTFDLILFVSSLHHIPDRAAYFRKCAALLNPGGRIVVIEPKHGFWRIVQLLKKFTKTHYKRSYWMNRRNLSTHHFLTLSEARSLARAGGLTMTRFFSFAFRGERYFPKGACSRFGFAGLEYIPLLHLFATQVFVEFEKPAAGSGVS